MHPQEPAGMKIGKKIDGVEGDSEEMINVPPSVLKGDYGRFSTKEEREDALVTDMLSVYQNTTGPMVLLDAEEDDLVDRFLKSHWKANDKSLDDVYNFKFPETAPGFAPFSIDADLQAGIEREEAIMSVVDSCHRVGEQYFGEGRYQEAPKAIHTISALIKALYDQKYVEQETNRDTPDTFDIDELIDTMLELSDVISGERENPFKAVGNDQARSDILNLTEFVNEERAMSIWDAALFRLNGITENKYIKTVFENTDQRFDFRNYLSEDVIVIIEFDSSSRRKTNSILGEIALSNLSRSLTSHDKCRCTKGHETPAECYKGHPTDSESPPDCRTPWGDDHLTTFIMHGNWRLPLTNSVRRLLTDKNREADLCIGISTNLREQLNASTESTVCEVVQSLDTVLAGQDTGSEKVNNALVNNGQRSQK